MIEFSIDTVIKALEEICSSFIKTKHLKIKKVILRRDKNLYVITLKDGNTRYIEQELINDYIKSFGAKGKLEIAGRLLHSPELEQSVSYSFSQPVNEEDIWDGDIKEVYNYLDKKEKEEGEKETDEGPSKG